MEGLVGMDVENGGGLGESEGGGEEEGGERAGSGKRFLEHAEILTNECRASIQQRMRKRQRRLKGLFERYLGPLSEQARRCGVQIGTHGTGMRDATQYGGNSLGKIEGVEPAGAKGTRLPDA